MTAKEKELLKTFREIEQAKSGKREWVYNIKEEIIYEQFEI
jgi:hypothetical protein